MPAVVNHKLCLPVHCDARSDFVEYVLYTYCLWYSGLIWTALGQLALDLVCAPVSLAIGMKETTDQVLIGTTLVNLLLAVLILGGVT